MLQAMNTGHEGSLTTIHANSTREALTRVELMIGLAGIDIPVQAIRKLVASSVNLIVQVSRLPGGKRKVVTISEITGMEGMLSCRCTTFLNIPRRASIKIIMSCRGLLPSRLAPCPQCLQKLNLRGANLPQGLFNERAPADR